MFCLPRLAVAATLAVLLSLIASPRAQAIVIAHENFESYAAGSALAGGSSGIGWSGNWTGAANVTVENFTLTNGLGDPVGETKSARISGAAGDVASMLARNFGSTSANTVYMALLARVENFDDGDFLNTQLSNGASGNTAETLGIGFRNAPGNPLFARSGTSSAPGVTADNGPSSDNTNYLLVAKLTRSGNNEYEMSELFINPATTTEPGVADASAFSTQPSITALSRFNVRDFNPEAGDVKYIDQVRIATTFGEAVAGLVGDKAKNATLPAFADAHVMSGTNAGTNFGTAATLAVKNELNAAGNFHRKAYIQFDVSAVDLDALGQAALQLTVAPPAGGADPAPTQDWTFAVYGLRDDFAPPGGKLNEGWLESALNWNNAPGNNTANGSGVVPGDVFGAAPLATFVLHGVGVAGTQISLTDPNILNFIKTDTDGVATFLLVRLTQETGSNSVVHAFHSRTSTAGQGPTLELLTIIPEPSTALLGLVTVGGLALRRRRAA